VARGRRYDWSESGFISNCGNIAKTSADGTTTTLVHNAKASLVGLDSSYVCLLSNNLLRAPKAC
jgi:hypothetical protein